MMEHQLLTEAIATCKREDLQRGIEHARLVAQVGAPRSGFHPRRAVAGALMRVATVIDSNAARGGAPVTAQ